MNTTKSVANTTMSAPKAAAYLALELGGKVSNWEIWLANDRRPGRVNRQLHPVPGPGRPRYLVEAVKAYATTFRAKQNAGADAIAARKPSGVRSSQFTAHVSAVTGDEGAAESFVLVATLSPMRAYRLSAEEARGLAQRLLRAAADLDESKETGPSKQTEPFGKE